MLSSLLLVCLCHCVAGRLSTQAVRSEFVDPDTPHTIVYPVRVDHLGRRLDKEQSWRERSKRETLLEYPDDAQHDHQDSFRENSPHEPHSDDESEIFLKIDNAGDDLVLRLRPNRNLRLRGTVVEWVLPNGATILKSAPENCFMVGSTVGHEKRSLVAVSGCSGFTGLIQSGHNSYFIEPLNSKLAHPKLRQNLSDSFYSSDVHRTKYTPERPDDSVPLESSREFGASHRELTGSLDTVTLPEPHVMYKVDSILRRLNISLYEDQEFERDDFNKGGRRRHKRSAALRRDVRDSPHKPRKDKGFVRKTDSRASKGKASGKKKPRDKRRKKRNRRHNKKNREIRQRCRELKDGLSTAEAAFDSLTAAAVREGESSLESELTLESFLVLCAQEEERRNRRRQEREERKQAREERLRAREIRRQAREEKKRQRQQRRSRRKEQSQHDLPSGSASQPWSKLNGSEWHGGYSPDLLWEVAQPAHSPSALEEDLSVRDSSPPPSSPKRWLEVTVAVDNSIIDFHGEDNTEQYIFTLFNIVSAIYQDPSLGANLELVLLRLICYTDAKQSQVRAGEAKSSLEAVNRWASRLYHASQTPLKHDLAVWLTRLPLGGPSGYAPVGGVCHPARSCTLNRDEGLTSAFIIAHEMGHVLGLSHDGDASSSNACVSEGLMGSVMAPLVAATFTNFHWSRCSRAEYLALVSSWDCMTTPPSWANATTVSSVVSYHYSLDDQCRMEFGEGFGLCRSFGLADSCSHLWCANSSAPHLCKTKKGPPLEGTVCGEGKWCRFGVCSSRSTGVQSGNSSGGTATSVGVSNSLSGSSPVRHNPQHGGWSDWGAWGPCSATCGAGVAFRSRACDSPVPRWGGKSCRGKKEEWRTCGEHKCTAATDVRADHCSQLANLVELDQRMSQLQWLPYEPKSKRLKCRVSCYSRATNEMYLGHESLRDGTPCSYDSPSHHICVQGKCVELGCDLRLGSGKEEDVCGECEGDGSSCSEHSERYFGTPGANYSVVAMLPAGARHISVEEEESTSNFLALAQMSNVSWWPSVDFPLSEEAILINPDHHVGPARSVVSDGALFHYNHRGDREWISARGPLLYEVAVLIHGGSVESPVHVSSTYHAPHSRPIHRWIEGPLGPCSTTCGGGQQRPQLECVERESGKRVPRVRCASEAPPPDLAAVPCNTFSCNVMWTAGAWEHCSATCGVDGVQQRVVSCVAVDEPQVPIDPLYCPVAVRPPTSQECERHPCPAYWHLSGWTQCEGECGSDGTQEALWSCPQAAHSHHSNFVGGGNSVTSEDVFFDCGQYPARETRTCTVECGNQSSNSSDCRDADVLSSVRGDDEYFLSSLASNSISDSVRFPVNFTRCNKDKARSNANSGDRNNISDEATTFEEHDDPETNSVLIISNPFSKNSFIVPRRHPSVNTTDSEDNSRSVSSSRDEKPNITSAAGCVEDVSTLCKLPSLRKYCSLRGYKKLCCLTCAQHVRN